MGYLYQPTLKSGQPGRIWWVKYYVNGRPVRESTGSEKETEARRFLKAREGRVATGQPLLPRMDRIRYEEIAADLRQHLSDHGLPEPARSGGATHATRWLLCRVSGGRHPCEPRDGLRGEAPE